MIGTAVTSAGAQIALCGQQRLITAVGNQPPEPAAAYLRFKLVRQTISNGCAPRPTFPLYLTEGAILHGPGDQVAVSTDTFEFNADVGSYRVRPAGTARLVIDGPRPTPDWTFYAGTAFDPCELADEFWWTRTVAAGPIVPPPFYHRLRVAGGAVTRDAVVLTNGVVLSLVSGQLTAVAPSVIQWGLVL